MSKSNIDEQLRTLGESIATLIFESIQSKLENIRSFTSNDNNFVKGGTVGQAVKNPVVKVRVPDVSSEEIVMPNPNPNIKAAKVSPEEMVTLDTLKAKLGELLKKDSGYFGPQLKELFKSDYKASSLKEIPEDKFGILASQIADIELQYNDETKGE